MPTPKTINEVIKELRAMDDSGGYIERSGDELEEWLRSSLASVVLSVVDRLPNEKKEKEENLNGDSCSSCGFYMYEECECSRNQALIDCRTAITKYAEEIEKGNE